MCDGFASCVSSSRVALRTRGVADQDQAEAHVGCQHLETSIAIHVEQANIGDCRAAGGVGRLHRPGDERQRVRGGPGRRRRKPVRGILLVVAQNAREVRWQDDHPRGRAHGTGWLRQIAPDQRHACDFITPGGPGEDVGRREGVARSAGGACVRFRCRVWRRRSGRRVLHRADRSAGKHREGNQCEDGPANKPHPFDASTSVWEGPF